jgi:hypothetical protein
MKAAELNLGDQTHLTIRPRVHGAETGALGYVRRAADLAPLTPRLVDEATAAAYLDIGKTGFRCRWQTRELPQPHRIGQRLLWDVKLLDAYVDALSGLVRESNGWEV